MHETIPTIENIVAAYERIKPFVQNTPVLKSELLNKQLDCQIWFKCENFQGAGAFKYRGATNATLCLTESEKAKGVTTHSSGNHAGALAKAAALNGIKAHIVIPDNAPKVKIEAVKSYGAEISFCSSDLQSREETLAKVQHETGATFIHPFDNFEVVCGQGTACLELREQIAQPDIIMAPVGGGGLLSGTSITAKSLWQGTKVIAAEPLNANDAYKSFYEKKLYPPLKPNTIADGLLTALSNLTFSIILKNVDEVLTCSEESIVKAMRLIYQYLKIVVEPSSAVPLATIIENKGQFKGKNIAIIISGGNVDFNNLPI